MLKKIFFAVAVTAFAVSAFAYNPPAGGENLLSFTSPFQLTSAQSTAGGALSEKGNVPDVTPGSIIFNPALTAQEQRIVLDVGYTALFSSLDQTHSMGGAFETGILIPTKWCTANALLQGVFVPFEEMSLGNSINLNLAASKEITERLNVGLGLGTGILWGYNTSWRLGADVGVLYKYGNLGFLKNTRIGVSMLNLGKNYSDTVLSGIRGGYASEYPGLATLRTGIAATLFEIKDLNGGFSFDLSAPEFQNFVVDTGLQFTFKNFIKLSTSWQFNTVEFMENNKVLLPSVGLSFKFVFTSGQNSYLAKKGWDQSEMTVGTAWQQLYGTVNATSAGAVLKLGLEDTTAPSIELGDMVGGQE